MVGIFTRSHAAEIDLREARSTLLDGHRGKEFHDIGKFIDLQLVKLLGSNRGDRDGNVLQILLALLRGNDDFVGVFRRG
nr:hypothetical protein [Methylocucumis oryzae]